MRERHLPGDEHEVRRARPGENLGEGGDGNADANGDGKVDIADWVRLNQVLFPADPTTLLPQVRPSS